MITGYLLLNTGEIYEGQIIGSIEQCLGEVVFNTSMTGYQEIISDPSYAGQLVTFCYPLIGNYGINPVDFESIIPHAEGVIIGENSANPSHYLATQGLSELLAQHGKGGLTGIDTRALVKHIRAKGTVYGKIVEQLPTEDKLKDTLEQISVQSKLALKNIAQSVSTKGLVVYPNDGSHIVLIDFGFKKSILDALLELGCHVTVVPYTTTLEELKKLKPDGVLFSNGPGDPMDLRNYFSMLKQISMAYPTLGICLGHQVIALAHGAQTKRLTYGHRGGNHPVKDLMTGKVTITSQNHGYVVVDEGLEHTPFIVTHQNINDGTIEGLKHKHLPIQLVQFHPEAHPGPRDNYEIIVDFVQSVIKTGEFSYATT